MITCMILFIKTATWRNGYAEDCKSFYPSSILGVASKKPLVINLRYCKYIKYSSVAQLVEQLTVNQLVAGSSPARGANYPTFSNFEVLFNICNIFSFWTLDKDENVLLRKE